MRFTCTLAAFLVAAAAAAPIVGAAPLPGISSGQAQVRARRAGDHYEDRTGYPVTYAYTLASQSCSAGENHVISQADCIGNGTNSYQGTTSKVLDFLKSRGEVNRIDNQPIRPCGRIPGANAKGCWSNGDSLVYVTGEVGTESCDAVAPDTRIGPVCAGIMRDGDKVSLKSWKGDYLHRPDSAQGVTTWSSGIGNEWTVELAAPIYKSDGAVATYDSMANMCTADGSSLCSVDQVCPDGDAYTAPIGGTQDFGDMWLPVVDAAQLGGKQWVQVGRRAGGTCNRLTAYHGANLAGSWMETTQQVPWKQMYACCSGKISLKSWKGDSLHRPDSAQGVTTLSSGIGNEWTVELLTSFKVVEVLPLGAQSCSAGGGAVMSHVISQADCIGDGTTSKMLARYQSMSKANRIDNFPIRNCGEVVGANAKGCWSNGDSLVYVTGEVGTKSCEAVASDARVGPVCFRLLAENADGGSTLIELEEDTVINGREAVFIYEEGVLVEENEAVELGERARQRRGRGKAIKMKWPLRKGYLKVTTKIVVGQPDGHSNSYCKQRGCV